MKLFRRAIFLLYISSMLKDCNAVQPRPTPFTHIAQLLNFTTTSATWWYFPRSKKKFFFFKFGHFWANGPLKAMSSVLSINLPHHLSCVVRRYKSSCLVFKSRMFQCRITANSKTVTPRSSKDVRSMRLTQSYADLIPMTAHACWIIMAKPWMITICILT